MKHNKHDHRVTRHALLSRSLPYKQQHSKFFKSLSLTLTLTLTMLLKRFRPKISPESEQFVPGILTVSAPEEVKKSGSGGGYQQGQIGNLFDKCHFCKKRMRQQDDAFMCGSLHAFCTPLCRDKQIVVDKVVERVAKQPRGAGVEWNASRDVKDRSGFQVANCASLQ